MNSANLEKWTEEGNAEEEEEEKEEKDRRGGEESDSNGVNHKTTHRGSGKTIKTHL